MFATVWAAVDRLSNSGVKQMRHNLRTLWSPPQRHNLHAIHLSHNTIYKQNYIYIYMYIYTDRSYLLWCSWLSLLTTDACWWLSRLQRMYLHFAFEIVEINFRLGKGVTSGAIALRKPLSVLTNLWKPCSGGRTCRARGILFYFPPTPTCLV